MSGPGTPGCRGPWTTAVTLTWGTYPLLIHHDVVAPMLFGQVWGQDVKAPPELRKHHVVRVTWGSKGEWGCVGSQDTRGMARDSPTCPDMLGLMFWEN